MSELITHGVRGLADLLSTRRFDLTTEKATQAEMAEALVAAYGADAVSREHRLGPGDIPDFPVAGRWVVEVKGARHRRAPTWWQLGRYAGYLQVEALILATSRAMSLPSMVGGKPLAVLNLGRAWL